MNNSLAQLHLYRSIHGMVQGFVKVWGLPVRPDKRTKQGLLDTENF